VDDYREGPKRPHGVNENAVRSPTWWNRSSLTRAAFTSLS
jgi:hypothetical protein